MSNCSYGPNGAIPRDASYTSGFRSKNIIGCSAKFATIEANDMTLNNDLRVDEVIDSQNVKFYGVKGDGVTDDTAAIQAAINASGGNVLFPTGVFAISQPLVLTSSDFTLSGEPGAVLLLTATLTEPMIQITGSVEPWIGVAANYTTGASSFEVLTPHGYAVNDWVRIMGQRNAIAASTPYEWRAGRGTSSFPNAYYAEFLQVETVPTDTTFTTMGHLYFIDYLAAGHGEGSGARTESTFRKYNFVHNGCVKNLTIRLAAECTAVISARYAYALTVEDVFFDRRDNYNNGCVVMQDSFRCSVLRCRVEANAIDLYNSSVQNAIKFISCQQCRAEQCEILYMFQAIDWTYTGNEAISFIGQASTNIVYAPNTTAVNLTCHGGTWAIDFMDNVVYGGGIYVRSPNCKVVGNMCIRTVDGITPPDVGSGYGIWVECANNFLVQSNFMQGFRAGVLIVGANTSGSIEGMPLLQLAGTVSDNLIRYCYRGISSRTGATTLDTLARVIISNNQISNITEDGIHINSQRPGWTIINNYINTANRGILVGADCYPYSVVRGNMLNNVTTTGITVSALSGSIIFTYPTNFTLTLEQNTFFNCGTDLSVTANAYQEYIPATPADWGSSVPTTIRQALDTLAANVVIP